MLKKITVYWRDIPAQIILRRGRKSLAKWILSERFQKAIDSSAMRAGKGNTNEYIEEWRRASEPLNDENITDYEQMAKTIAEEMEQSFSDEKLTAMIRNHGLELD